MSRWITTFVATSLVLMSSTELWSWGGQLRGPANSSPDSSVAPSMPKDSFPLNDHQDWYVRESYLLWSPHEDDADWGNRFSLKLSPDVSINVHMKKPDFGWYSGARLAVGRYLPNHDHWDISLISTYFYAESKNHASPSREKGGTLNSTWSPIASALNYDSGKGVWRLNFFTWDLAVGRDLFLSSKITAHPFFALRNFLIYEDQAARYSGHESIAASGQVRDTTAKFKGHNNSWGIGPRVGSDFTYYLKNFWTIMGSLSGSVLFGSCHVGESISTHLADNLAPNDINHSFRVSDNGFAVRSNLEGSIGMGWEKWVKRNRVRIAPSVVFEAAQWFDVNQWIVLRAATATDPTSLDFYNTDRRHGDLTFLGFTFNLQVDF